MKKIFIIALISTAALSLAGCQAQMNSKGQVMGADNSQVALRQIQTRAFDTTDRKKTMRTIIATLQDLGFVIDKADETLGTVSGTKLNGYSLRMTVTIRPRGNKQTIVRANAQYNITAVEDPEPYQQFFAALEKSIFLTAQQVD